MEDAAHCSIPALLPPSPQRGPTFAASQPNPRLSSEAASSDPGDYCCACGGPPFQQTTLPAFQEAGAAVTSMAGIVRLGVCLITVRCGQAGYGLRAAAVRACSEPLEREAACLPGAKALLLMGGLAIQALKAIARPCAIIISRVEPIRSARPSRPPRPPGLHILCAR